MSNDLWLNILNSGPQKACDQNRKKKQNWRWPSWDRKSAKWQRWQKRISFSQEIFARLRKWLFRCKVATMSIFRIVQPLFTVQLNLNATYNRISESIIEFLLGHFLYLSPVHIFLASAWFLAIICSWGPQARQKRLWIMKTGRVCNELDCIWYWMFFNNVIAIIFTKNVLLSDPWTYDSF